MRGDEIRGDIGSGQRIGIRGLLLSAGMCRGSDLDGRLPADAVIGPVAALPDCWARADGRP